MIRRYSVEEMKNRVNKRQCQGLCGECCDSCPAEKFNACQERYLDNDIQINMIRCMTEVYEYHDRI